jgi:hypothetical protein
MESVDAVEIVLERTDEFGSAHRSELTIDKDLERLSPGEIGFSLRMARPSWLISSRWSLTSNAKAYVLTPRFWTDCEGFRRIKDYNKRCAPKPASPRRFEPRILDDGTHCRADPDRNLCADRHRLSAAGHTGGDFEAGGAGDQPRRHRFSETL